LVLHFWLHKKRKKGCKRKFAWISSRAALGTVSRAQSDVLCVHALVVYSRCLLGSRPTRARMQRHGHGHGHGVHASTPLLAAHEPCP
jgi:hypothetical protein